MTPDDLTPHTRADARHARHRRHRRRIEVGTVVAVIALVAGAAGAVWATKRGPFAATTATTVAADPVNRRDPVERTPRRAGEPACGRALTTGKPLRLWIAGDSLAGSLGPALGEQVADTGVVAPVYDSRVSSGLANPGFYDWPKHATAELARLDPEAVAFIIGTNDYVIVSGDGTGTAAWVADYTARTEAMMKLLVGPEQRTVYWVSPPIMKTDKMSNAVRQIGDLQRSVARQFPTVTFIDAYSLLDDGQGEYTATTKDPTTGRTITLRAGDGVHFSPDGADLLASAVYQQMDTDWCMTKQAVAGARQPVIETKGSTYIPGTRRTITGSTGTTSSRTGATGTSGTSGSTGSTGTSGSSTTSTTTAPTTTTVAPTTTTAAAPAATTTSHGKP